MDDLFQMLAGASDGVFVIKEDQRIIYWNKAAQQILGYTAREVIGRNCHEILKGCDDEARLICYRHCRVTTAALDGNTMPNYDIAAQTKLGDLRWINVTILRFSPSGPESTLFIIHLFHDVTQSKCNEQFIRHLLDATKYLQTRTSLTFFPPVTTPLTENLTDREREVLSLLAQGLSTSDVASSLSISSTTVRNHIQNILNKLQVHSRLEAVAYAFEHGFVQKG